LPRLFIFITVTTLVYIHRFTGFNDWIATGIAFLGCYRFDDRSEGESPKLAEGRLLPGIDERLLTRKLMLKLDESAAIADPQRTLDEIFSTAENGTKRASMILPFLQTNG